MQPRSARRTKQFGPGGSGLKYGERMMPFGEAIVRKTFFWLGSKRAYE